MPRFFTQYWNLEQNRNSEGDILDHTAGNLFHKRGIRVGDVVYVVSTIKGSLYLCGRLVVGKICDIEEATTILDYEPWPANEHIIAEAATPMNFNLRVPLKLTRQLRFISGKSVKPLKFKAANYLDAQTLRGVRRLDPASAAELDVLLPPMKEILHDDRGSEFLALDNEETSPEEVVGAQTYYEGATKHIIVNVYERNAKARRACISRYGVNCFVCGFNFKSAYGDAGDGFIHVHHLKPLSEVGEEYELDPVKDLHPVCPNCHAMIHRRTSAYTIAEMKQLLSGN